ncbi:hypothetical protein K474DRAFT_1606847 [Panus rudis PR-1116 ss-1]|nr:hypothetical protein K474DRAFT_1606847 [Panus rudis PR-1116 ss-1]
MSECYPSTRCKTLQAIENWCNGHDQDSLPVFWLQGPPGIGKTAISKSVASYAQQRGVLAANFFFSIRIGSGCSDGKLLFPTMAHQLVSFHPSLQASISATLREDIELPQRSIDIQFRRLFQQPLLFYIQQSLIDQVPCTPLVIVLDGLDECIDHDLMKNIIRNLVAAAPQLHPTVKLFLASRPEYYITSILRNYLQTGDHVYEYDFQCMEWSHSSSDVEVYLRDNLNDIAEKKQWNIQRR